MTQHPVNHRKLWLEKMVKENDFRLGAELGVHEGVTHFHLLDHCKDLTMIGVDIYKGPQEKYWQAVSDKISSYGIRSRFYRDSTVNAANNVGTGEIDFVFIDADHKYKSVLADLKAWAPKVRKGGYITGHDCNHSEVKKAIDEFFGQGCYQTAQDEVWYVQK